MTDLKPVLWKLKRGLEKKFNQGHPWVFSSDLSHSPKGISAGDLIELQDQNGQFLAVGYGNPHSLIAFRKLTQHPTKSIDVDFWKNQLLECSLSRRKMGVYSYSHRLCYAEGDELPGLVIDRYRRVRGGQVFVLQSSTAGVDRQLENIVIALEKMVEQENLVDGPRAVTWGQTVLILSQDSSMRKLEGLPVIEKKLLKTIDGFNAESDEILIENGDESSRPLFFKVDFLGGQKTGFFLDQRSNVRSVVHFMKTHFSKENRTLKILDLCCYVGQWGTQLSNAARGMGLESEVTLLDASSKALELARQNVISAGGQAQMLKADVLQAFDSLAVHSFDIVICDPPAFIKGKKDLPQGRAAYVKLNREALRRLKPGGMFFSSSCSGLLDEETFREVLATAVAQNQNSGGPMRWIFRGAHAPDHPIRPEFPQGMYLKSWLGVR